MDTQRIILSGERPLSRNRMMRLHFQERNAETQRVHWVVREAIDPNSKPFAGPVHIRFEVWQKGQLMDANNLWDKPYIDALVGWLIVDDSPEYVPVFTYASYKDNRRPRVEITLEPVLPPPF